MQFIKILLISILVPALLVSMVARAEDAPTSDEQTITEGKIQAVEQENEAIRLAVEQARHLKRDIKINELALVASHPARFKLAQNINHKAEDIMKSLEDSVQQGTVTRTSAEQAVKELLNYNYMMMIANSNMERF